LPQEIFMLKKHHLILLFTLIGFSAYAQMPGMGSRSSQNTVLGRITGNIIDSTTSNAVEFATVSLSKKGSKKVLNGATTDEKGNFKIENVKPGEYTLTIAFLGYLPKEVEVETTPRKLDAKLSDIILTSNAKMLNSVEVTADGLIENRVDKLVYNAEKDVTSTGGDASEVLKKVPMVTVDMDGNVSLRGSSNIRILLNGKPSGMMAGSVADALKMIPADQIKSVEVITSPSAKYDGEGSAGIINIITKKSNMQGFGGQLNTSVSRFSNRGNGNFSYKTGRVGFNAGFGGWWSWPRKTGNEIYRETYVPTGTDIFAQNGTTTSFRGGGRGRFGMDWDINQYNTLSFSLDVNGFSMYNRGNIGANLFFSDTSLADVSYNRFTNMDNDFSGYDFSTDYKKTFVKKDQELSFNFQYGDNRTAAVNTFNITDSINNASYNDGANKEMALQTDYTHPLNKNVKVETGVKGILRDINSNFTTQINNVEIGAQSNNLTYAQDVAAGYVNSIASIGKNYQISAGVRAEQTFIQGRFQDNSLDFSNDYLNVLPAASFSRTFKKFQTVKLQYNKRIQRPSLFYLNPYNNSSDPRIQTVGDPTLRPEVSDKIEVGYSSFWKGTMINTAFFASVTNDVIEGLVLVNNGLTVNTFRNLSKTYSYGANVFGSVSPIKNLTIRGNVNVYYNVIESVVLNRTNEGLMYNINGFFTYQLPKNLTIEGFAFMNSPRITAQGTNPSFSMMSFGMKKEFNKKKMSLGLNIINPLKRNLEFKSESSGANFYQTSNFIIPFRSVGVSFNWNFGKLEFRNKEDKKNNDLKQGGDGQGGGF
jgi:ferric enterobactin receptor